MIKNSLKKHIQVAEALFHNENEIQNICKMSIQTLKNGNKIILCGNGGSASDANHIAAELVGRFKKERNGLPSISLSSNNSNVTSIANDYGFENIFSRQLDGQGVKGDLLIGITTSGNSINVINAFTKAKEKGIYTIALLGRNNGLVTNKNCDLILNVQSANTARIQEMHILIGHILCEYIDEYLK